MSTLATRVLYDLVARDQASRTFVRVGESATALERKTAGLGAAISKSLKVGGLALGAFAIVSGKLASDFQSSMTKVSTQAGGTAKDVKVLSDQVLKLGGKVQQAPEQLADSLYHLKSVGMDNVQAMKALRQASDLAAVGGSSLEETTNALAGAWRTGIKGAGSFHEAVSTVNAIIGAGNMRMEDFNAAIGTGILPSAKAFGLSLKQVGAALALMTDEGVPATDAATRLRMSFSLLGAPSMAAEKQLKKIGLTGIDLATAMRGPQGLIGAIQLLKDHLDASGLSAAQQSQILSRAFGGGRSSSGIITLINNLDVLKKKQDQVNNSAGKFDDAVAMQRKTAEAQWKRLVSGLESLSVRFGTKILPPVTGFVGFLNDKAMPAAAKFGRTMAGLVPVAQIERGFSTVKGLVGDFLKGFSGTSKTATDLAAGLFGTSPHLGSGQTSAKAKGPALAPMPHYDVGQVAPSNGRIATVEQFAGPHGGSGLTAPLAKAKVTPQKSAAQKFGETIRKAVSGGIEGIDSGKIGSVLGKALGTAIGWVGKHAADLTKKLGGALSKIDFVDVGKAIGGQALPFAIGFVVNLFEPLFHVSFWKKHAWDTVLAILSVIPIGRFAGVLGKVFEHIPFLKVFEPLLSGFGKLGGYVEKALGKAFGPVGRGIARAFKDAFPAAEGFAKDIVERFVLGPARRLSTQAKLLPKAIGTGIENGTSYVTGKVISFTRGMLSPFAKIGGWLLGKGGDFVKGLGRGIADAGKGLGGFVWRNAGKPAVDAFKTAGSWLLSKGRSFVSGLKTGAVDAAKGLGSWAWRTAGKPAVDAFADAGSWLLGKGKNFVIGMKNGVVNGAKGLGSWTTSHVINPARNAFSNFGTILVSKGSAFVSGMKAGIVGAVKGIGSWIKKYLVDPVVGAVKHFFGIKSPSRVFMGIGGHLVSGLMRGMAKTSGTAIAKKVFGSLPKALAAIAKKGLVSISALPAKALKALGGLGGDILGLLGLGGGGSGSSANQKIGQVLASARGWSGPQWAALKNLWNGESGWNERALNKSSGAYGIAQALPASKYASAGSDWKTSASTQIKWGLSYIASRYGNPLSAYSAWLSRSPHWYAKGTRGAARGLAWVGERGAELVNFGGGEDVLNHEDSIAFAKTHGIRLPGYASGTVANAQARVNQAKKDLEEAQERHYGIQAAKTRLKAAEQELANAKRRTKTAVENSINNGFKKTLTTGTAAAIAAAIKSMVGKLQNAGLGKKFTDQVIKAGEKLQSLANKKASVGATIKAANQYAADQSSNIRDFLSISGTSATSVGGLISQMQSGQKTVSGFADLTKSLKARGASKELLAQLAEAGPGSQLATILGAKNVTTTDIGKLNGLVKSGNKLADNFGKSMADTMYDSGKHAGEGFLAGLKAQQKDLEKAMSTLADSLVKSIKKKLKIKSPSQVFRDEVGKQLALGMVRGMDDHRPHVAAAARRLATTARAASADAAFDRLAQAMGSSGFAPVGGGEFTGQLVLDSGELLGVIKGTVKPMISESEQRQAYRAKVGRR
ncbi:phage tail tape measure protein [Streptomyces sp. NPDC005648]|uniref:phage tail tape measure protein n=1 Tax=Streptomyces sp. NPDC005648 TaxID=3157044 RepID=UPI0033AFD4AC